LPGHRKSLSADEARRVALAAQGFARPRPANPSDVRHFRRALHAIGVLQLDFVNVLLPAHFLMIWSRLGGYDRKSFEQYLYDSGEFTEQWAHEASVVRVSDWPLLEHRRQAWTPWKRNPLRTLADPDAYLRDILVQVSDQGAITANDLPEARSLPRVKGDWHRPVQRWALEHHFGRGTLCVRRRLSNFQRVYDLPERLIPQQHRSVSIDKHDAQRALLAQSAEALGVATLQDLADYYRMPPREAAPRVAELVEEGTLSPVQVEGWSNEAYLHCRARFPRAIPGASLLSPFDPVTWYRPRAERLFDFEYRIEIYVPAAKRRWGYYVLPFRLGDRIVARVDLKADRAARTLQVRSVHYERNIDQKETESALKGELGSLASWLGLDRVSVY
jgi:uncharacterized protein YcaQ